MRATRSFLVLSFVTLGTALVFSASTGACGDPTEDVSPSPDLCAELSVAANGLFPGDGEQFFFNGNPLVVDLTIAADSGSISVTDGSGTDVPGSSELVNNGRQIRWMADDRLLTLTTFTATITADAENACSPLNVVWSFRTSDDGMPMDDPSMVVDRTYALDLTQAVILDPPGIGGLIQQFLNFPLFVHVQSYDDVSTDMVFAGAIGDDANPNEQDYCTPTIDFPAAQLDNPDFAFGPTPFTVTAEGYTVTLQEIFLGGTFRPDASGMRGVSLRAEVDVRDLEEILTDVLEDGDPCELLQTVAGISCKPCPADDEPFCLSLNAINIEGEEVSTAGWAAGSWVDIGVDVDGDFIPDDEQTENHLCGNCADGDDDDGDGDMDGVDSDGDGVIEDPECDPASWP